MTSKHLILLLALLACSAAQSNDELQIPVETDNQFPPDNQSELDGILENSDVNTESSAPLSQESISGTDNKGENTCPLPCICITEGDTNSYKVDCTGHDLTELPQFIDSKTTELILDNNNLTEIPNYINALSNLKILNLSNNQISTITEGSISELSELTTLNLANNLLSEYPQDLKNSYGLTQLKELDLGGNTLLTDLNIDTFSNFEALQKLTVPSAAANLAEQLCALQKESIKTICTESCESNTLNCSDISSAIDSNLEYALPGLIAADVVSDNIMDETSVDQTESPELLNGGSNGASDLLDEVLTKETDTDLNLNVDLDPDVELTPESNLTVDFDIEPKADLTAEVDLAPVVEQNLDTNLTEVAEQTPYTDLAPELEQTPNEDVIPDADQVSNADENTAINLTLEADKTPNADVTREADQTNNVDITSEADQISNADLISEVDQSLEVQETSIENFSTESTIKIGPTFDTKLSAEMDAPEMDETANVDSLPDSDIAPQSESTVVGDVASVAALASKTIVVHEANDTSGPGEISDSGNLYVGQTLIDEQIHNNEQIPVVEQSPVDEPPVDEPPVDEQSPQEDQTPVHEQSPQEDQTPVDEQSPQEEQISVDEQSPQEKQIPVDELSPEQEQILVDEQNLVDEQSPQEEQTPVDEQSPQEEQMPVDEQSPQEEQISVDELSREQEQILVDEENPVHEKSPQEEQTPIDEQIPVDELSPEQKQIPVDEQSPEAEHSSDGKLHLIDDQTPNEVEPSIEENTLVDEQIPDKEESPREEQNTLEENISLPKQAPDTNSEISQNLDAIPFVVNKPVNETDLPLDQNDTNIDGSISEMDAGKVPETELTTIASVPEAISTEAVSNSAKVETTRNSANPTETETNDIQEEPKYTEPLEAAPKETNADSKAVEVRTNEDVSNSEVKTETEEVVGATTSDTKTGGVDKSVIGMIVAAMVLVIAGITIKKNWSSIRNRFSSSERNNRTGITANGTSPEEVPLREKHPV